MTPTGRHGISAQQRILTGVVVHTTVFRHQDLVGNKNVMQFFKFPNSVKMWRRFALRAIKQTFGAKNYRPQWDQGLVVFFLQAAPPS